MRSFHVPNVTSANLKPIIVKHAHWDSKFVTDESPLYQGIGWAFKGGYATANHSAKEYVRDNDYANTAEGFFSILKRGIYGIYQHVSEAHLHRYPCEYDFRYTYRAACGVDETERMRLALAGIVGKRLTYRKLVETGQRRLPPREGRDHVWRRGTHVADSKQCELGPVVN